MQQILRRTGVRGDADARGHRRVAARCLERHRQHRDQMLRDALSSGSGLSLVQMIANSSPPSRAAVSDGREHATDALRGLQSTASPASWPRLSLTP